MSLPLDGGCEFGARQRPSRLEEGEEGTGRLHSGHGAAPALVLPCCGLEPLVTMEGAAAPHGGEADLTQPAGVVQTQGQPVQLRTSLVSALVAIPGAGMAQPAGHRGRGHTGCQGRCSRGPTGHRPLLRSQGDRPITESGAWEGFRPKHPFSILASSPSALACRARVGCSSGGHGVVS